MKFVAMTTGYGRTTSFCPGVGFQGTGSASKPEEYATHLLELYAKCRAAVEGEEVRSFLFPCVKVVTLMRSRILLALALSVWAATPVVSQLPEKSGVTRDYSKEAYVIEKIQVRITDEADGSGSRELSAEIKVLAEAGVKAFAVLNFTYTSANEVVDIDYVRVRKPDGVVVKTPDYNVQDMPAEVSRTAPLYSDIHEKHVAVKGLGVGDVLEYLVRFRVVKPQVPGQFWYEHSFSKDAIIKDEKLEISVPVDKYVKVVSPEFKPEIKDEGARRIYRWTHSNLEVQEKDPNEIPRPVLPCFGAVDDVCGLGKMWGAGMGACKKIRSGNPSDSGEGRRVDERAENGQRAINTSHLQFCCAEISLHRSRFRYRTLSAPRRRRCSGQWLWRLQNRKHTLMAALLKASGYDAWPALIHSQRKLDPDVPSLAQFNHVITVVPIGNQLIWLDTTPEVAPYGLLLVALRDKQTLGDFLE